MQTKAIGRQLSRLTTFIGVVVADVGVVLGLRQSAANTWRHLPHLGRWLATTGCDRALAQLAGAALWVAALWLAVGLLSALAATLPGWPGRLAAGACRAVLPRAARKLLAGTAGLGVLLAPAAALATPSPAAAGLAMPAGITVSVPHSAGKSLPPPAWPTTKRMPAGSPTSTGRDAGTQSSVRVRPGDCLWLLAAGRLPAGATNNQIAAHWPQWYAANRAVIGPDPDLLQPGEILHVPAPSSY